jgi:hypothetical protein
MAFIICKIHVLLAKSNNVIENIQIHISSFFWFEILHKCEKKKKKKGTFDNFCLLRKKSQDFQKN